VCLITGGAGGIGKATAKALLREGDVVHVADLSRADLDQFQQELRTDQHNASSEDRLHVHYVDVTDRSQVEDWVQCVHTKHGRIDVLVHCAVYADWNPIEDQSVESILRTMSVGFDGMVHCTKSVLPRMIEDGYGRIVYLSSVASTMHLFKGYAAYAALKSATDAWSNILRIDLRDSPVKIANVRPGIVKDTNLFRRHVSRTHLPRLFDWLPAADPETIAKTIVKATHRSNRSYVVPWTYRVLDFSTRCLPGVSRWLCRWGTAQRTDLQMKDDDQ